ncbi:MAG: hypothetical protein ACOH12_03135 [Parvibaculaceae bacterium]
MPISFVPAWKKNDPKLEEDAINLWAQLKALTPDTKPEERAKSLAVVAYDGDEVAALSTLEVQYFEQLRQKFAFVRVLVAPSSRMQQMSTNMMRQTRAVIEAYALEQPEEQIAGMGAVFQHKGMGRTPIGAGGRTVLVGYTKRGYQLRVAWFDHFMVPAVGE